MHSPLSSVDAVEEEAGEHEHGSKPLDHREDMVEDGHRQEYREELPGGRYQTAS